jgi:hypothetical protein
LTHPGLLKGKAHEKTDDIREILGNILKVNAPLKMMRGAICSIWVEIIGKSSEAPRSMTNQSRLGKSERIKR